MKRIAYVLIGVGIIGTLCAQAQVTPQAATTQYGISLMGSKKWLEAEQVWHTVLARPGCKGQPRLEALLYLARTQANLQRYAQARVTLDEILTQMVLDQPSMLQYGSARALVERTFLDALDPDPAYLDAALKMALDDFTRTNKILDEYLDRLTREITSTNNNTICSLVRNTSAMPRIASALGRYRQARPGHPFYSTICLAQAKILLASKERLAAKTVAEEAWINAAGTGSEQELATMLVETLMMEEDTASTVKTMTRMADQYPTNTSLQNKAMSYLKRVGAVSEAVDIALRLTQTEGKTQGEAIKTLYWAGELAIAQGNTTLAKTCMEAFIKAAPEMPSAKKARKYLMEMSAEVDR